MRRARWFGFVPCCVVDDSAGTTAGTTCGSVHGFERADTFEKLLIAVQSSPKQSKTVQSSPKQSKAVQNVCVIVAEDDIETVRRCDG